MQGEDGGNQCGIGAITGNGGPDPAILTAGIDGPACCPVLSANDASVPEILWIGCSDALLLPHQLLNLSRGQILVHRNFGNCAPTHDLNFLSVLEYALGTLNIKHIIVAGHHDCQAVKTVLDDRTTGLLHHWLAPMNEMYALRRKELSAMIRPQDQEYFLATMHARHQVRLLSGNPAVREYWAGGHTLSIHGWVYREGTDQLHDLGISVSAPGQ